MSPSVPTLATGGALDEIVLPWNAGEATCAEAVITVQGGWARHDFHAYRARQLLRKLWVSEGHIGHSVHIGGGHRPRLSQRGRAPADEDGEGEDCPKKPASKRLLAVSLAV